MPAERIAQVTLRGCECADLDRAFEELSASAGQSGLVAWLEDHDRIRVGEGGGQHAAGVGHGGRRHHPKAGDVGVDPFEAVAVLGRQLAPGPVITSSAVSLII